MPSRLAPCAREAAASGAFSLASVCPQGARRCLPGSRAVATRTRRGGDSTLRQSSEPTRGRLWLFAFGTRSPPHRRRARASSSAAKRVTCGRRKPASAQRFPRLPLRLATPLYASETRRFRRLWPPPPRPRASGEFPLTLWCACVQLAGAQPIRALMAAAEQPASRTPFALLTVPLPQVQLTQLASQSQGASRRRDGRLPSPAPRQALGAARYPLGSMVRDKSARTLQGQGAGLPRGPHFALGAAGGGFPATGRPGRQPRVRWLRTPPHQARQRPQPRAQRHAPREPFPASQPEAAASASPSLRKRAWGPTPPSPSVRGKSLGSQRSWPCKRVTRSSCCAPTSPTGGTAARTAARAGSLGGSLRRR